MSKRDRERDRAERERERVKHVMFFRSRTRTSSVSLVPTCHPAFNMSSDSHAAVAILSYLEFDWQAKPVELKPVELKPLVN